MTTVGKVLSGDIEVKKHDQANIGQSHPSLKDWVRIIGSKLVLDEEAWKANKLRRIVFSHQQNIE